MVFQGSIYHIQGKQSIIKQWNRKDSKDIARSLFRETKKRKSACFLILRKIFNFNSQPQTTLGRFPHPLNCFQNIAWKVPPIVKAVSGILELLSDWLLIFFLQQFYQMLNTVTIGNFSLHVYLLIISLSDLE